MLHDEMTASPLIPTPRFTTAAATGVAQRQLAATDATVADLRREMRAMREMLQSVRPGIAASTDVTPDPPAPLPGPSATDLQWPDTQVPGASSMGQLHTGHGATPHLPRIISDTVETLLHASLAPSSRAQYERSWSKLVRFMQSLNIIPALPVSIPVLMGFIAYIHNEGYAPASIITTLSAMSYVNGLQDPAKNFLISKLLTEAQNLRSVSDVRLPITLPILAQLIRAVPLAFTSHYNCLMLHAMIVLAFKAYLRVGEMVSRTNGMTQNCLQFNDVTIPDTMITVYFRHFKHSGRRGPQSLQGAWAPDTSISAAA